MFVLIWNVDVVSRWSRQSLGLASLLFTSRLCVSAFLCFFSALSSGPRSKLLRCGLLILPTTQCDTSVSNETTEDIYEDRSETVIAEACQEWDSTTGRPIRTLIHKLDCPSSIDDARRFLVFVLLNSAWRLFCYTWLGQAWTGIQDVKWH